MSNIPIGYTGGLRYYAETITGSVPFIVVCGTVIFVIVLLMLPTVNVLGEKNFIFPEQLGTTWKCQQFQSISPIHYCSCLMEFNKMKICNQVNYVQYLIYTSNLATTTAWLIIYIRILCCQWSNNHMYYPKTKYWYCHPLLFLEFILA